MSYDYDRRSASLRTAGKMPDDAWTEKGSQWKAKAQYAGGTKHNWTIKEVGGKFSLMVEIADEGGVGDFKSKKDFGSLEQAQKYAWKFIDKANGHEMLDEVLKKDFQLQK